MIVTAADLAAVARHLQRFRVSAVEEPALHARITEVLTLGAFVFEHEVTLDAASRVDFLLTIAGGGHIAIEVKVRGTAPSITEQLLRYAQHPKVGGVLLVTTLRRLAACVPPTLNDKPALAAVLSLGVLG